MSSRLRSPRRPNGRTEGALSFCRQHPFWRARSGLCRGLGRGSGQRDVRAAVRAGVRFRRRERMGSDPEGRGVPLKEQKHPEGVGHPRPAHTRAMHPGLWTRALVSETGSRHSAEATLTASSRIQQTRPWGRPRKRHCGLARVAGCGWGCRGRAGSPADGALPFPVPAPSLLIPTSHSPWHLMARCMGTAGALGQQVHPQP